MDLQLHQLRVVKEKAGVDVKLNRLEQFIPTEVFSGLPVEERARMLRQAKIMRQYSDVLAERIAAFKGMAP